MREIRRRRKGREEMKYAYFPGCSLHSTAKEYGHTTKSICANLGIELEEIKDWNCCGATPAHQTNRYLAAALPLRNIAKAEKMGMDMIVPCAACFSRSKFAQHSVEKDDKFREKVIDAIGMEYTGKSQVKHFLEVIMKDLTLEKLKEKVVKPLAGLRAACYYGCLLTRPPEVSKLDDAEEPQIMEKIMTALGATPVEWSFKTECCGASSAMSNSDAMLRLTGRIIEDAVLNDADCVVVACPLCHANLDMRQDQINKKYNKSFKIPVFYITQMIGLATGSPYIDLSFHSHLTDCQVLLKEKSLS